MVSPSQAPRLHIEYTTAAQPDGSGGLAGDTTTGLMAHYTLDDGDGGTASDGSGNGNHGDLVGAESWTTGHHSGGLQLESSRR